MGVGADTADKSSPERAQAEVDSWCSSERCADSSGGAWKPGDQAHGSNGCTAAATQLYTTDSSVE